MGQKIQEGPARGRVALYLRVSTGRQAESDLSIPDQRRQLAQYAEAKGWPVAAEFVEPGNTATDDKRPAFQAMIDAGLTKPAAFDTILVHSFSRFFRDQFQFEFYTRKLARNGVRLISITQEIGDDPMGMMVRQIMSLFDEYQSRENAKHTLRAMKENARQGFWNGSQPPIGYRVADAEQRGVKMKRRLVVDDVQAETVKLMYRLALMGHDNSGPMGVKAIACYLNDRAIRTRDGGRWGVSSVHHTLTRTSYIGEHHFNTRTFKTGEAKPASEHVIMAVPPIIEREDFEAVQILMAQRNPRCVSGRFVNSPVLLGGISFCGLCGGAMTLRTGKNGQYRYYTCCSRARTGPAGCGGITVRMDVVDAAVVDHLENRLLHPDRLEDLMSNIVDRRQTWMEGRRRHVSDLRKRATEATARLTRLYEAIEGGVMKASDPQLKDRVRQLQELRDVSAKDADRAERAIERLGPMVTPELLRKFSEATRQMLRNEDGTFRRDLLRAIAQRVEIKSPHLIEISGSPVELFRTLAATSGEKVAAVAVPTRSMEREAGLSMTGSRSEVLIGEPGWHRDEDTGKNPPDGAEQVLTRVPNWRALQDSNLRPFA